MKRTARKSRKLTDLDSVASSSMTDTLFDAISVSAAGARYKHEVFDRAIASYVAAWSASDVARVYLGAPGGNSRSFYLRTSTHNALKAISASDRVSVSVIIRTALAWWLNHEKNAYDPWGSDHVSGTSRAAVSQQLTPGG